MIPRAFLILIDKATYDNETKKMKHRAECHLNLQGPAKINEDLKSKAVDVVNGPWKVNYNINNI